MDGKSFSLWLERDEVENSGERQFSGKQGEEDRPDCRPFLKVEFRLAAWVIASPGGIHFGTFKRLNADPGLKSQRSWDRVLHLPGRATLVLHSGPVGPRYHLSTSRRHCIALPGRREGPPANTIHAL